MLRLVVRRAAQKPEGMAELAVIETDAGGRLLGKVFAQRNGVMAMRRAAGED